MRVNELSAPAPHGQAGFASCVVLKIGSSILRSPADLPEAASEIYRFVRLGVKTVAVVSAFAGETDRLIGEAKSLADGTLSRHAASLVALGEERAAAQLACVCDAIGLDAEILGPRALALQAGGPADDAHPEGVDIARLTTALQRRDVVIVPGFAAVGPAGDIVLLGRGGSDLTAAFLASALGLGEATLLKDVDGVYDRDPALHGANALRFSRIGWAEAGRVAGRLVQTKAIAFAAARQTAIRIRRTGDARSTLIGATDEVASPAQAQRSLRVAVAGLGVVGGGAALRLAGSRDFELVGALVRDPARPRGGALDGVRKVSSIEALLALAPDVIVDALSDGAAGRALTEAAIARGVGIVSANKQAIAGRIHALRARAEASGAPFLYSAAVGGGTPIIETVRRVRAAGEIHRIEATLNGTVNFILSGLQRGDEFASAVAAARAAGLAEDDPSNDLSGADAAAKAAILIEEAFGVDFDPAQVSREALDEDAYRWMRDQGGVWRQVTTVCREGGEVSASIALVEVAPESAFARSSAEGNAVRVETQAGGLEARGRGAGRAPTVESVLADLGDARREILAGA